MGNIMGEKAKVQSISESVAGEEIIEGDDGLTEEQQIISSAIDLNHSISMTEMTPKVEKPDKQSFRENQTKSKISKMEVQSPEKSKVSKENRKEDKYVKSKTNK